MIVLCFHLDATDIQINFPCTVHKGITADERTPMDQF